MPRNYLHYLGFQLCMLFACTSCGSVVEREIDSVLSLSGNNRAELEAVLSHYDHDSIDELERDAADFLIANMKWHDTEVILPSTSADALEEIYSGIDSVIYINACRNVMEVRNDVADTDTLPEPITFSSHIVLDCQMLNSSLLIKQIENQFRLWKSKSDVTNVSFDDFCEYLLPYTSHTCPLLLPLQQRSLHDFLDSYKDDFEIQEFADSLDAFQKEFGFLFSRELRKLKYRTRYYIGCFDLAYNATLAFRMVGIPATLEMNIGYKHYEGKHYYCSVLKNGKWHRYSPMTRRDMDKEIDYIEKMGGMNLYRYTYSAQKNTPYTLRRKGEYIPMDFQTPCIKDVTNEVFNVVKLKFPITDNDNKLAYLATFNREEVTGWRPVTWGIIRRGTATFENVIPERLYVLLQYRSDGTPIFMGKPFYVTVEGGVNYIKEQSSMMRNVLLHRKFPYKIELRDKAMNLKNAMILGTDDSSFYKADTIGKFPSDIVPYYQDVVFDYNCSPYQYYRISTVDSTALSIAELQLLTKSKYCYNNTQPAALLPVCNPAEICTIQMDTVVQLMPQNSIGVLQDGKVLTYEKEKCRVDIQLKYPQHVTGIRFMPVNADNIIKPGQTYLLYGWDGNQWTLEKKQTAQYNYLQFDMCVGRLYWLRVEDDYLGGREESPFVVNEQGKIEFIYK